MQLFPDRLEARFEVGFPARGRTVLAFELKKFCLIIYRIWANQSLYYRNLNCRSVQAAVALAVDQSLYTPGIGIAGLVAFGSRRCGSSAGKRHFRPAMQGGVALQRRKVWRLHWIYHIMERCVAWGSHRVSP